MLKESETRPAPAVRVIGLTGGIATGKSSVARFFQTKGALVIDADQLARDAVEPGTRALNEIIALFGDGICAPDGRLDRKRLGELVFSDSHRRSQLEGILHPEIRRMAKEMIASAARSGQRVVFYMAPLLIEAGVSDRVDEIWVVTTRPDVQLERLMSRDGISLEQARRMIASQMPLAEKEHYGRIVIDNSGTPEQTRMQLEEIWVKEIEAMHEGYKQ